MIKPATGSAWDRMASKHHKHVSVHAHSSRFEFQASVTTKRNSQNNQFLCNFIVFFLTQMDEI